MSLTKDWMREDNTVAKAEGSKTRARRKAIPSLLTILLIDAPRKVGAGFERLKRSMSDDERAAIAGASSDDHLKQRVS